jgi:hypothetical protein
VDPRRAAEEAARVEAFRKERRVVGCRDIE